MTLSLLVKSRRVCSRLSTCDLDWNKIRAEDQFASAPAMEGCEELEKAIKELPRDKEVVQLCQKLTGANPLPAR